MDLRLDGKCALVTGADSGIGRAIAVTFAEAGAGVTVGYYSDRPGAEETAEMARVHGVKAQIAQGDVGDPAVVERIFATHDSLFGRIDVLVNNAGLGINGAIVDLPF